MHSRLWSDAISEGNGIPIGITKQGPIFDLQGEGEKSYRRFVGQLPEVMDDVNCAENLLAYGAVEAFLKLWNYTKEQAFLTAAQKLVDIISTQLEDADAGPASDIIRTYTCMTAGDIYTERVKSVIENLSPYSFKKISMESDVKRAKRPGGIGKRQDMPVWYEDGQNRRHNPILLALAAEIASDVKLAVRAIDIARTYFMLARKAYSHGREHGCAATTVSAIARGHGRDNNAGVVTSVLMPTIKAFKVYD